MERYGSDYGLITKARELVVAFAERAREAGYLDVAEEAMEKAEALR